MAKLCSVKQYVLLWYHGIIFHELNNTLMTIWVIWPLILWLEFLRHVYHLCFVYVAKLEADVSIHVCLKSEFISLLMVAINFFLPRQDSTWIKVTIKEKCRVLAYVHTASDLVHLKKLKGWIQKTQLLSFRPTPYPACPTLTCINQSNICNINQSNICNSNQSNICNINQSKICISLLFKVHTKPDFWGQKKREL